MTIRKQRELSGTFKLFALKPCYKLAIKEEVKIF